jgi:hypothetical protein
MPTVHEHACSVYANRGKAARGPSLRTLSVSSFAVAPNDRTGVFVNSDICALRIAVSENAPWSKACTLWTDDAEPSPTATSGT